MKAIIKTWCGKLESISIKEEGFIFFIGSDYTQFGSSMKLPDEKTTTGIRHEVDGDIIHLASNKGAMMGGGGHLSDDERRVVSNPEGSWVSFNTPIGTLDIPGLQQVIKEGNSDELNAVFNSA